MSQHFQVRWRRQRDKLDLPELDRYPATPAGYYTGYYPATVLYKANRSEFDITKQETPEHGFVPNYGGFPGSAAVEGFRSRFNVTLQEVPELDRYKIGVDPATTGYFPGSIAVETLRSSFDIKRQELPELDQYTEALPSALSGFYPGSAGVESNHTEFKRKLQKLPEYSNYFKITQPVTAWMGHFEPTKNTTNRRIPETLEKPYTPNYGFYPATLDRAANQSVYDVRALKAPEHNVYPVTPAVPEQAPTAYMERPLNKRHQTRKHLRLLDLNTYPETQVVPLTAFYAEPQRSRRQKRNHELKLLISEYVRGVDSTLLTFGVSSIISPYGQGVVGLINVNSQGVTGLMTDTFGVSSRINENGQGVAGIISDVGQGVAGLM